jgi:hypothetical protein
MENEQKNSGFKAATVVLSLLLVGSLGYNFRTYNETKTFESKIAFVKSEKNTVMDSLVALRTTYENALKDKTSISKDLISEKLKVESLISDLKKSNGSVASMNSFRTKYNELQNKMQSLLAENDLLKKTNQNLLVQRDSTVVVAQNQRKSNDTLNVKNKNLEEKVTKASRLVVTNLKTQSIKEKKSGKQIETDKASRANKLKISFSIAANEVAEAGEKMFYVQVIDSQNNVLGEKKTEEFGDQTLTYSFVTKVEFNNQTIDVTELLDNNGKEFEKGTYFVNVFDKNQLTSKTSFALR